MIKPRTSIIHIKRLFLYCILVLFLVNILYTDMALGLSKEFRSIYDSGLRYTEPVSENATCTVDGGASISADEQISRTLLVGFSPGDTENAKTIVTNNKLGGVFFTVDGSPDNLTAEYFSELNTLSGHKLFIASDDEGGDKIALLGKGIIPTAKDMAGENIDSVKSKGKELGDIMKAAGMTGNLAPVLDIETDGTIWSDYKRNWSSDPAVVTEKAGAFSTGLLEAGITPVYKHFPGLGKVTENTDTTPSTPQKLSDIADDLIPYQMLLGKKDGSAVMLSNGYVTEWGNAPVSVNQKAVNYLRTTLNFNGIITTDALNALSMKGYVDKDKDISISQAVVDALNAGVDMPLFIPPVGKYDETIKGVVAAVKSNVSTDKINAAFTKVQKFTGNNDVSVTASDGNLTCCTTGTNSSVVVNLNGADNTEKVLNNLLSKKDTDGNPILTLAQAAGVIANFKIESTEPIVPNIQQGQRTWPTGGWGIAQWTQTPGRRADLVAWLQEKLSPADFARLYVDGTPALSDADNDLLLSIELDFFWYELLGPEGGSGVGSESASLQALLATTDPQTAATEFERTNERCSPYNGEADCAIAKRKQYAQEIFETYSGSTPGSGGGGNGATAGCNGSLAGGAADGSGLVYYAQGGGQPWSGLDFGGGCGTIAYCGCGLTSMAMIISTLTGQSITPDVLLPEWKSNGWSSSGGTTWGAFTGAPALYDLQSEGIYTLNQHGLPDDVLATAAVALREGKFLIASGNNLGKTSVFTSAGHIVVIRGITAEGKFLISDPKGDGKKNLDVEWDPKVVGQEIKGLWAIWK